jgi:uncharacterized protein
MNEGGPLADLARTLASALQDFAEAVTSADRPMPGVASGAPPRPEDEHTLGKRQRQIVEVPGLAAEDGMKTADIAAAIDYEVPNTYAALQALARSQVVEQVPDRQPQHWRLARRYRGTSRSFAEAVATLAPGEWTTAADVSIAVRGDVAAADAVARAELSPRVLADERPDGGSAERLAGEGTPFLDDGRPDPRARVTWDELARRVTAAETRRRSMARGTLNYIQVPSEDLEGSISFYEAVFGWEVERRPTLGGLVDQTTYPEFTDSTGQVGGAFVLGRPAAAGAGFVPCVAVDSIEDTLNAVVANGGEVVQPRTPIVEGTDWEAVFRDPAGNAFGLYEQAAG